MAQHEWTASEVNAALARVDAVKARYGHVGAGELAEFGLRPSSFLSYALDNARSHRARIAHESREVVFAGAWLDGVMVGIALAEGAK